MRHLARCLRAGQHSPIISSTMTGVTIALTSSAACQQVPKGDTELGVYLTDQGATITDRFYVVHQGSLVESFESSTTVVGRHTVEMMLRLRVARGSG